MRTGVVKQFEPKASFGFIEDDQNHKSYFVFYTAIKEEGYKRLEAGQRVRYQLRKCPELNFYLDDSLDYIQHIDDLLAKDKNQDKE